MPDAVVDDAVAAALPLHDDRNEFMLTRGAWVRGQCARAAKRHWHGACGVWDKD